MSARLSCALAVGLGMTMVTGASAQNPQVVIPQPPALNPEHYECYTVVGTLAPHRVKLRDQFRLAETVTAQPRFLCNPVSKNGEEIKDALTHLVCYGIGRSASLEKKVEVANQFGRESLLVRYPYMLCVPSGKRLIPG